LWEIKYMMGKYVTERYADGIYNYHCTVLNQLNTEPYETQRRYVQKMTEWHILQVMRTETMRAVEGCCSNESTRGGTSSRPGKQDISPLYITSVTFTYCVPQPPAIWLMRQLKYCCRYRLPLYVRQHAEHSMLQPYDVTLSTAVRLFMPFYYLHTLQLIYSKTPGYSVRSRMTKIILISFIPCSVYKSIIYDFPTTFIHLYWELSHTRFAP
jgi:hypothetical protein